VRPPRRHPAKPSDFMREAHRGQHSRAMEIVGTLCVLATLPFWLLAMRMFEKTRLDPLAP
jgi:hypothetical protein